MIEAVWPRVNSGGGVVQQKCRPLALQRSVRPRLAVSVHHDSFPSGFPIGLWTAGGKAWTRLVAERPRPHVAILTFWIGRCGRVVKL